MIITIIRSDLFETAVRLVSLQAAIIFNFIGSTYTIIELNGLEVDIWNWD